MADWESKSELSFDRSTMEGRRAEMAYLDQLSDEERADYDLAHRYVPARAPRGVDFIDTPAHVRGRVAAVFGAMSGVERLLLASEMADEAREISLAGLRSRNPELDEDQISVEWIRMLHGDDVADFRARCSSIS